MAGPIGNLLAQSGWEGLLGSPIGISRLCSISMGPANSLGLFDDDWLEGVDWGADGLRPAFGHRYFTAWVDCGLENADRHEHSRACCSIHQTNFQFLNA
jgi:hypothetical protein